MSTAQLIASYLQVAREDLDGAGELHAAKNRNAIYLCEQAVEKMIRAVLTSEGTHAGIKHDLDQMVDRLPDENPLKAGLRGLEHLSAYATSYRYPTAAGRIAPAPDSATVAADIANAAAILDELATRFGVALRNPGSPATRPAPIR